MKRLAPALSLLFLLACGSDDATGPGPIGGLCASGVRSVRIVVLDAWGRSPATSTLQATDGGGATAQGQDQVALGDPVSPVVVEATSPDLVPASVRVTLDPTELAQSTVATQSGGALTALSTRTDAGCTRLTVWVGLDHPWYAASGRPPREGNVAELFLDGEPFWTSVAAGLASAQASVRGSTWWWQSDFELTRPAGHETMSEAVRRPNTALALLDGVPAVKRILVNRFLPETASGMAYLNTDPDLRSRGTTDGDGFEVMLQGNPTQVSIQGTYTGPAPVVDFARRVRAGGAAADETFAGQVASALDETFDAASFHQKTFVVDGRVAWVAGMNVKSTDWDTNDHRVFDSRRMKFASTGDERQRVAQKRQLPDLGPRKDYGVRIEGPAARDVDDVLRVRWDLGLTAHDLYWDHATPFTVPATPEPGAGTTTVQVVVTLPQPIAEQSILETWTKALRNATRYIYIEDQYFRMPMVTDVIVKALNDHPALRLIVVTKPMTATDGGKKWTVVCDDVLRAAAGDRYLLLQLRSFDAVSRPQAAAEGDESATFYFQDMDTHSKILMVDDEYLSVGSCNKNNRGLLYEGELNVAVHDQAWVTGARQRIFRNLVGPALEAQITDDDAANFALLKATADANAAVEAWWRSAGTGIDPATAEDAAIAHHPAGFVYPLAFTPDALMDVGPDAF